MFEPHCKLYILYMCVFLIQAVIHCNRHSKSVCTCLLLMWHKTELEHAGLCFNVFHCCAGRHTGHAAVTNWSSGRERVSDFNFLITLMNPDPAERERWEGTDKPRSSVMECCKREMAKRLDRIHFICLLYRRHLFTHTHTHMRYCHVVH